MRPLIAVFDTNILIDILNGIEAALIEAQRYEVKEISIISWMEVLAGAPSNGESAARTLFEDFELIPITDEIAERAVIERKTRKTKLPDSILIATATVRNGVLITRNTRDFPEDEEHVRIPYRLPVH